ncbi:MAG: hypothetical protein GX259_08785 [Bacteroidales bacterium]|nr:hypothetical protein [Bacteroidales bacterium]
MKKINLIFICIIVILLILLYVFIKNNKELKIENNRLSNIYNELIVFKDSFELIKSSYLLVDNVAPIVVNTADTNTGRTIKQVFLVIRDCNVKKLRLITGNLDTSNCVITDTTRDITINNEKHFYSFLLYTKNPNEEIEGAVELFFGKKGYIIYPFSEKQYNWWE